MWVSTRVAGRVMWVLATIAARAWRDALCGSLRRLQHTRGGTRYVGPCDDCSTRVAGRAIPAAHLGVEGGAVVGRLQRKHLPQALPDIAYQGYK
jgi:hypothetical protein